MPRVPTYSDVSGRVAPSGRLQPLSAQTVSNFGAKARALAAAGEGVAETALMITRIQEKRMTDEGRVWVLDRRNSLLSDISKKQTELIDTTPPEDFLKDKSSPGVPDPESFTSKSLTVFDELLSNDYYLPPNKMAEQMWREESLRIRGQFTLDSIKYQAQARTNYIKDTLEQSINDAAVTVQRDPSKLMASIDAFKRLTETADVPGTPELEGVNGSISRQYLDAIYKTAEATFADAALLGLSSKDPLGAIKIISDGSWDNGRMYGIKPERLNTLRNTAISNLDLDLTTTVNDLEERVQNHVASLSKGGPGDVQFNTPEGFQNYIKSRILREQDLEEIEKYVPKVSQKIRQAVSKVISQSEGKMRIARMVPSAIEVLRDAGPEEIQQWLKLSPKLVQEVINEEDIAALEGAYTPDRAYDLGAEVPVKIYPTVIEDLRKLTTSERVEAVNLINTALNDLLKERAKDPANYILQDDWTQTAIEKYVANGASEVAARMKALDAKYDRLGYSQENRKYLTNDESKQLIANIKSQQQTPDQLVAGLLQLEQTYGNRLDDIWRQLTTEQNGLDERYMFLGAVIQSPSAQLIAEALITQPSAIKEQFAATQDVGTTYADVQKATNEYADRIIMSMSGGLPHRVKDLQGIKDLITDTVALSYLSGRNRSISPEDAVENFIRVFEAEGSFKLFDAPYSDRVSAFITPEHVDSKGTPLLADPEAVARNAEALLTNDYAVKKTLGLLENVQVLIPGSQELGAMQEEDTISMRTDMFYGVLASEAYFTLSDDGNGMMLVYPSYGGASISPVMVQDKFTGDRRPFILPFDKFTKPVIKLSEVYGSEDALQAAQDAAIIGIEPGAIVPVDKSPEQQAVEEEVIKAERAITENPPQETKVVPKTQEEQTDLTRYEELSNKIWRPGLTLGITSLEEMDFTRADLKEWNDLQAKYPNETKVINAQTRPKVIKEYFKNFKVSDVEKGTWSDLYKFMDDFNQFMSGTQKSQIKELFAEKLLKEIRKNQKFDFDNASDITYYSKYYRGTTSEKALQKEVNKREKIPPT